MTPTHTRLAAMPDEETRAWLEYDDAARHLAQRGLKGEEGDALPSGLSSLTLRFINDDLEAFQERVRECAYALARERHEGQGEAEGLPALSEG